MTQPTTAQTPAPNRAPLSKAAIRMMVGQLAGERAQEEGR